MDLTDGELASITLAEFQQPGQIERDEQTDGSVRYRNLLLLATGVWGDSGTERHFLYSERTTETLADNVEANKLNLFHERENGIVEVGELDENSLFVGEDDGGLYGDLVLSLDNDASRMTDDLLQQALESGGREGIKGPSLEIRGDDYEFNEDEGIHELIEGAIIGVSLVGLGVSPGPGSEDAAFSEQARERAVALAASDGTTILMRQHDMKTKTIKNRLEQAGITLADNVDAETIEQLADTVLQDFNQVLAIVQEALDSGLDPDSSVADLLSFAENELDADTGDLGDAAAAYLEAVDAESLEETPVSAFVDFLQDQNGGDDEPPEGDDEDGMEEELAEITDSIASLQETVESVTDTVESLDDRVTQLAEETEPLREADVGLSDLNEELTELREEKFSSVDERLTQLEESLEEPTSLAEAGTETTNGEQEERVTEEWGTYPSGHDSFQIKR